MYRFAVAATMGFNMPTAITPMMNATQIGACNALSADRPAARVTTSSDERASDKNNTTVARIMISGRIRFMVSGVFNNVIPKSRSQPIS